MRTIEKWRNLEVSYIGKLAELQSEAAERNKKYDSKPDMFLVTIFETLQNQHKNLTNKINHDIFLVNFVECEKHIQ